MLFQIIIFGIDVQAVMKLLQLLLFVNLNST